MIDVEKIMIQYPDQNKQEILEWIKENPLTTEKEIIDDINEGLFEDTNFLSNLYDIWKSNNNGKGFTKQQTLWIFKYYDILQSWSNLEKNPIFQYQEK